MRAQPPTLSRRAFLGGMVALPVLALPFLCSAAERSQDPVARHAQLAALEAHSGGRLGVCCLNTANGSTASYRGDERFPLCSTFKAILAAAVLRKSMDDPTLLARPVPIRHEDIVTYSPVTEPHVGKSLPVETLCAAAVCESDNTAANLLMRLVGGPAGVQAYTRSIGDETFRLDRWETELNTALPGDPRDTSTPDAMAATLHKVAQGDALAPQQRALLVQWLKECRTGGQRIRAGLPEGWMAGDKTGSGDNGTSNDIAVIWPPQGAPLVLTVYLTMSSASGETRNAVIRDVAALFCA